MGGDSPAGIVARRVRVRGLVQGVGYRHGCVQEARRLRLAGWVRNRVDGSVEAVVAGEPAAVDAFIGWLRHGVRHARIDGIEVEDAPPQGPSSFEQRPTA
jgi:acylphosphatase